MTVLARTSPDPVGSGPTPVGTTRNNGSVAGGTPLVIQVSSGGEQDSDALSPLLTKGASALKGLVGPASIITVALYYFGWARSNAIANFWGYQTNLIGLSNEDYLLRSVAPMFRPLGFLVLVSLLAHRWAATIRKQVDTHRVVSVAMRPIGSALTAIGTVILFIASFRLDEIEKQIDTRWWWLTSVMIASGAVAIGVGLWLRAAGAWGEANMLVDDAEVPGRFLALSSVAAVTGVLLLGLFIYTTQFASRVGTGRAFTTYQNLSSLADVTLYSKDRLHLDAVGIVEKKLTDDSVAFTWRYEGLHVLTQGNDQLVLVPAQYSGNNAKTFVIPLNGGVRIDLDRTAYGNGAPERHRRLESPVSFADRCDSTSQIRSSSY